MQSVCTLPTLCVQSAGVGLSHLTGSVRQMLKKITSVDQDNYPEMLGKTCIINAPGAFKMIWSAVQGMIEPRTRAKIEVRGAGGRFTSFRVRGVEAVCCQWAQAASASVVQSYTMTNVASTAAPWQVSTCSPVLDAAAVRTDAQLPAEE